MDEYVGSHAAYYDEFSIGLRGDVRFYVEEAQKAGSPVLELACGTGRILIPVAQAGMNIVGLDRAPAMLSIAREKISRLDEETQRRIELVEGDMRNFYLEQQFKFIMIPYGSFLHLLTPEDQRQALERVHQYLTDDGYFIFNIFDPRLEWIVEDYKFPEPPMRKHVEFDDPTSGNRIVVWSTRRYNLGSQLLNEDRIFEEIDAEGKVVSRSYNPLNIRFTYRYEMEHLLELTGFKVEELYGDFQRGPFRYGGQQIWVTRKA